MKDGENLKKVCIFLIILISLPISINALEIDRDVSSGIILFGDEGVVALDTVLSVTNVDNAVIQNATKSFGLADYKAYNISLLENDKRITPNGIVTLFFPIPDEYKSVSIEQIYILKLGLDGTIETVYATDGSDAILHDDLVIENGYASFSTSDFKLNNDTTYLLGTKSINNINNFTRNNTIGNNIDNPKTLDTNFAPLIIITIIGVGGVMLLLTKLYLDNRN